ncbi:CoA-acylating methylmalonate-semialdehyde dehydrogenase [Falsirhodobacter algicola]|uniref:methylmalonate-semialdehyde dehydrogenase (CoA acylating) n=1 Tax=Falsirhodobacter algicola TaxID=2692330 RepID=A0A8J8SM75_9RHOB|nr:CoA-acylating methylmalonate-semialdehyde dehydrogenase [Falsirhodobacter algicola]QUS37212.1 CoA-acylating methylmalonate-semialdehyde dehydrogenase [Falsirhodobacter algicola]
MSDIGHFIGNARVPGRSGRSAPVTDPATGEQAGTVALAAEDEVDAAVAAAAAAFRDWSRMPPLRRARILDAFKAILSARMGDLARVISSEHGKTHEDALGEVTRGLEVVEFAIGAPSHLKGEFTENVGTGVDSHALRQPLGVVAGITPFNFPAMVPMWMFPVALACGNTFVLKPSERTPSAALLLAEWLAEAGLPAGVFNVVQGDAAAVDRLLAHPDVKAVSFVGSTPVARHVYVTGTANGKRVQALGGAKNHAVILPDADMEMVAGALMGAAYGSAGERCMAISVAVPVGEETADRLIAALVPRIEALRVGPASDPATEMGPVVTRAHLERVRALVARGAEEGARLVADGRDFTPPQGFEGGNYIGATLLDGVTPEMDVWKQEIFGPVLSVVRAADARHAAEIVARHEYGNGVAIFTRDGQAARLFAQEVEVGMVGINVPIPVPMAFHSFGGWKASLFGDHHMHGPEGVRFYTRLKTITSRWPGGPAAAAEFGMPVLG